MRQEVVSQLAIPRGRNLSQNHKKKRPCPVCEYWRCNVSVVLGACPEPVLTGHSIITKLGYEIKLYRQIRVSLNEELGTVDLESVFEVLDAIAQRKTVKDLGYFATYPSRGTLQPFPMP